MGIDGGGRLANDATADLIICSARNWSEFGARPAADRTVIRQGRVFSAPPPAYEGLDSFPGLAP